MGHLRPTYDVVIVSYNNVDIIGKTLESVFASSTKPSKVIVYDNCSKDESVQYIKQHYPQVILIEGRENLGFGRANNEASKLAEAEFILFMNNDLILEKNCVRELISAFTDDQVVILNPVIYKGWEITKNQELYAFGAVINSSGFGYGLYDLGDDRNDLNSFSAACFLTRTKLFRELQFENRFFLYYEEPELSVRILKRGLKIGRVRRAICYHLESYSSPKRIAGTAFRQFYGIQNHWYMLGKHWPIGNLVVAFFINCMHLLLILAFLLRHRQTRYLKIAYLAPSSLIAGLRARDTRRADDPNWTSRLSRSSVLQFLNLGSRVFGKKASRPESG
jgi:GT2 family glycosyltransferase